MNLFTKEKQNHRQNKPVVAKGEGLGGQGNTRISRCKLLYTGWINSKILLCSAGNYIQDPVIKYNGKECLSVYNQVTLLCNRDWYNIVNQPYSNKKK